MSRRNGRYSARGGKMNCPRCGHPCADHRDHCCDGCNLTEAQATRAAQRQAAAVTLWRKYQELRLWRRVHKTNETTHKDSDYSYYQVEGWQDYIAGYCQALRDLCISRPAPGGKE